MLFAAEFGLLPAIAVSAAATKAAAVAATSSAGSGPSAGLERRLRLSTQAARLRRSCVRLCAFARHLLPRAGARWLLVGGDWQEVEMLEATARLEDHFTPAMRCNAQ